MEPYPKVFFCQAIQTAFKNYVNFSGRSRRSEYWYFVILVNTITCILTGFLLFFALGGGSREYVEYYDDYYGHRQYYHYYYTNEEGILAFVIILSVYISFIMIPLFAATVRRLHDIGKRGEYIFVGLVPFFGGITLLVLLCKDSEKGNNEFGPSPKYIAMDENSPMALLNDNGCINPQINNNNSYQSPP